MPLTDKACKAAAPTDKPYKISDAHGLFLQVHPNGSKYWRYKYRYMGKEKLLSFGVYPEVSLPPTNPLQNIKIYAAITIICIS